MLTENDLKIEIARVLSKSCNPSFDPADSVEQGILTMMHWLEK